MDEPELDKDVVIQKYSADLIADFDRSLGPFLRKQDGQLRTRVRARETFRLVSLVLEPFQELPQLLDPHLQRYVPVLAEAYLEQIQDRRRAKSLSLRSQLLMPLANAICRIIYTFFKIRGEKVIVRFLNAETKYLEVLLLAIEDAERQSNLGTDNASAVSWTWHERYVVLLWLSQLFFAPFDLSTISSGDTDDTDRPSIPGFQWPPQIPGITLRVIPLGIKYLASPGRERDGAKSLLVRLAMRKDMQEIGILHALVQWALFTLRPTKASTPGATTEEFSAESPYYYIGSLALLAGVLRSSADTSIMNAYLTSIFYAIQAISSEDNPVFQVINGSALARKTMIKVIRSIVALVLRKPQQAMEDTEMVETSIGYLLEHLSDNDTPVRFAASKALSVITLKLDPDMALQVVEAVLESLNRNVLWVEPQSNGVGARGRNLTAVDPLEWHGLILTLSHLLYRRSPPPESLSDIIHALLMGLVFEKRGTSGGSIGTNVRDAACFGIWAVARRYTTAELLQVAMRSPVATDDHEAPTSILQVIATELVVTASLDPAGNIRRGSSAALQELIGRHPDTVEEGIAAVQAVDYHAVALRSRAIHQVALQATRLSAKYGVALLEALLGWRGFGDMDAAARRVAASAFGTLTAEIVQRTPNPLRHFVKSVDLLLSRIGSIQVRQVEERHGLILGLAAVFDFLPALLRNDKVDIKMGEMLGPKLLDGLSTILKNCTTTTYRKPELIAEAVSRLVVSSYPVFLAYIAPGKLGLPEMDGCLQTGSIVTTETNSILLLRSMSISDSENHDRPPKLQETLPVMMEAVNTWLNRNEADVMDSAAQAAVMLLVFSRPTDRPLIIQNWVGKIATPKTSRNRHGHGYFYALTRAYHVAASLPDNSRSLNGIVAALIDRWTRDSDIETRVAILQSLIDRDVLRHKVLDFVPLLSEGLDDYTTNARGDVGSHVRLEATRATETIWKAFVKGDSSDEISSDVLKLVPRMLRVAAEKLDRVRIEAQTAMALLLAPSNAETFTCLSFSSKSYFARLFELCSADQLHECISKCWALSETECMSSLLAGLATSADTGNEDLVIASRAAVADFCGAHPGNLPKIYIALINNLKLYQGQDRVIVPTLELLAYLFHIGVLRRYADIDLGQLCLLTQRAGYKTGNVRKIEACIKIYGGVASCSLVVATAKMEKGSRDCAVEGMSALARKRQEGIAEARRRLGALLIHPWPRVRTLVVDELWGLNLMPPGDGKSDHVSLRKLLGVDWGKAEKSTIITTVGELGLR